MPPLARFLLWHALIGFGIAVPFVGLLLGLNVGGLWTLIRGSDHGMAVGVLLTLFMGLTFGSIQMGVAVWQAGEGAPGRPPRSSPDDDDRPLPD